MKTFNTVKEARDYSKSNPSETVECKSYYSDGQLSYHCFYVNDNIHGGSKTYHRDGQLRKHSFYVNGKQHGEYKSYWSNGQLVRHCFYVGGKRNGEYKEYDIDGQLRNHCFYVDDEVFDVEHLKDRSYKSLCIKHTLFNGNLIDEDI